jgi:DNA-3-methyladenine glycosylase II
MTPESHLKKADPILAKIIGKIKLKERKPHKRYFEALCVSIINQQLSGKAAATIEKRFIALFPDKKFPKPAQVLKKSDKVLRTAGLSFQKISYIKSLAGLVEKGKIDFGRFTKLTDEEIIGLLTEVKGIGRWTAEMFLIFCLNRPDVFSHGDLGLRNAVKKWYKLDKDRQTKRYHQLVESWKPHRTAAARYLWKSLELEH